MYSRITSVSRPTVDTEISPRPEVLAYEVPLLLSVYTSQVDRTLSLDKSDYLRHCVLRWDRDQHMHVIRQKMTFLDFAFLLLGQFAEYISQMPTQFYIQGLPAALRNKNDVVFALPLAVT